MLLVTGIPFFYFATPINYENKDYKKKNPTRFHLPLSLEEKLALTLRFLATGEKYKNLIY